MKLPWLAFAAFVHTAVFIVVGLAVIAAIDALLTDGNLASAPSVWARYVSLGWEAIRQERRLPFALCVLADVVLLPAVFAVRATAATLTGRRLTSGEVVLRALLYATAASALFVVAMFAALAAIPYRLATLGGIGLVWYTLVVLVWNATFVVLAVPAQRMVDAAIRRGAANAPSLTP